MGDNINAVPHEIINKEIRWSLTPAFSKYKQEPHVTSPLRGMDRYSQSLQPCCSLTLSPQYHSVYSEKTGQKRRKT